MRKNRSSLEHRNVEIIKDFTPHAEGSVLYSSGNTKVLCNISIEEGVPRFMKDEQSGWLTAEYSYSHVQPIRAANAKQQEAAKVVAPWKFRD